MLLILTRICQDDVKYDKINSEYYGNIGIETHLKDVECNKLYVGNIVEIDCEITGRTHLRPVVEHDGQVFVMVLYRDWETDRKSTRLNSSHSAKSRMPSSA